MVSMNEAYDDGFEAAACGLKREAPYRIDSNSANLNCAWLNGYDDAEAELQKMGYKPI